MSTGQSTSQAAALAAFKNTNATSKFDANLTKLQQLPERNVRRNPSGRLMAATQKNTTTANAVSRLPQKPKVKPQLSIVTSGPPDITKKSEHARQRSISPLPSYRAGSPKCFVSPSSSSASLPQNMIKSVKDSIESRRQASEAKRLSVDNQPGEMLSKIRQSISDRTKNVPNQAKINERNMATINGIRESIDLKRITTKPNSSMVVLDEDATSSYNFAPPDEIRSPYEAHSPNYSYSSLESVPLAYSNADLNYDQADLCPGTPSIIIDSPFHSQSDIHSSREDSDLDIDRRKVSPITIPPSLHSSARTANVAGSADDARAHLSNLKYQVEKEKSEERIRKPKRKPPPELASITDLDGGFLSDSSSLNHGSSRSLFDAGSYLTDNESDTERHSALARHASMDSLSINDKSIVLQKRVKSNNVTAKYSELGSESEVDLSKPSVAVSRVNAPPMARQKLQHVQLKTTMRTTKKKKDKKKFDVDKPWKNHSDLDRISENDRKRYEGVWASNRGLYLKYVVKRLNGVDYGTTDNKEQIIVDEEDSMRAARLSAKQQANTVLGANGGYLSADFHNINYAEISQLIHGSVVQRIWKRSGLSSETLREIWDLVDYRKDGTLNKPEFLVGMWLVDQCLYGRKLTKKVPESVWESLEGIGLNVKKNKKK